MLSSLDIKFIKKEYEAYTYSSKEEINVKCEKLLEITRVIINRKNELEWKYSNAKKYFDKYVWGEFSLFATDFSKDSDDIKYTKCITILKDMIKALEMDCKVSKLCQLVNGVLLVKKACQFKITDIIDLFSNGIDVHEFSKAIKDDKMLIGYCYVTLATFDELDRKPQYL